MGGSHANQRRPGYCHFCGTTGSLLHRGVRDRLYGPCPANGTFDGVRIEPVASSGSIRCRSRPTCTKLMRITTPMPTRTAIPARRTVQAAARVVVTALEQLWLGALGAQIGETPDRRHVPGRCPAGAGSGCRLWRRAVARRAQRPWLDRGGPGNRCRGGGDHTPDAGPHRASRRFAASRSPRRLLRRRHHESCDRACLRPDRARRRVPATVEAGRNPYVAITPNPEGFGHVRFGKAWRGLDPPRHLHLLSPAALTAIAHAAGFRQCASLDDAGARRRDARRRAGR